VPDVPTIDSFPTFPRRRRSNMVRPTTPTFLSDPEAPPPTNPVVYSPVPTIRTFNGAPWFCSLAEAWAAGVLSGAIGRLGIASILTWCSGLVIQPRSIMVMVMVMVEEEDEVSEMFGRTW
jgi:hypothetical protein